MKKLISINPANQQIVGEISFTTNIEMLEKIQAAHAIKSQWKNIGAKKRVEILRSLISLFKNKATQFINVNVC